MKRSIVRLPIVEHAALRSDRLSDSHATYQLGLPQIGYYVPTITAGDFSVSPATAIETHAVADEQTTPQRRTTQGMVTLPGNRAYRRGQPGQWRVGDDHCLTCLASNG